MAQLGDEIKIVMLDSGGNQTLVYLHRTFKSDDGKYLVTVRRDSRRPGGLKLDIPEGA